MRVFLRDRGLNLSESDRATVERALNFALDRFAPRIKSVTVGLADLNGPRGGVDKRCRVEVALQPSGTVFIQEIGRDVAAVVHAAAERAGSTVSRELSRQRATGAGTVARGESLARQAGGIRFE